MNSENVPYELDAGSVALGGIALTGMGRQGSFPWMRSTSVGSQLVHSVASAHPAGQGRQCRTPSPQCVSPTGAPSIALAVVRDDPHDDKFIECAMQESADFIVTGDSHLWQLGEYQGIQIVTPAVFLAVLAD